MPIEWEEIEKKIQSNFPPFLTIEGRKGEKTLYITAPLREIQSRFDKPINIGVTTITADLKEIYTWNMPISIIRQLIDVLKDIDKNHTVYKVVISWLGEGRRRRYELLSYEEVKDKKVVQKIAELIKEYDGLVQLLKGEEAE